MRPDDEGITILAPRVLHHTEFSTLKCKIRQWRLKFVCVLRGKMCSLSHYLPAFVESVEILGAETVETHGARKSNHFFIIKIRKY